jgi:glycosyltransferase involved in cell wall biosynthesis
MRIAQVAPLYEAVPPKLYGGTERVASYLTDELVRQGHEVTLFASGDSETEARLVKCCDEALRLNRECVDRMAHHYVMLEQVFARADQFDLIHFHIDYMHFPLSRRHSVAHVTTLHGRLDLPDLKSLYREFPEMPVVSISDAQRVPLPWLNWQGTVRHGLPKNLLKLQPRAGRYLAFLGRISPEKRLDRAIEIARRAGMELKIAAKVDAADKNYFESEIRPLLKNRWVEYIGEIGEREKGEFLGNAFALLFPIDWPEPFGLVVLEAMACGTPVIAWRHGSVPEVVQDGTTGFIVSSIEGAVYAVEKVAALDRPNCRRIFERSWTSSRMANDYVTIYRQLAEEQVARAASMKLNLRPDAKASWWNSATLPEVPWPQPIQSLSQETTGPA